MRVESLSSLSSGKFVKFQVSGFKFQVVLKRVE